MQALHVIVFHLAVRHVAPQQQGVMSTPLD